jgi:hypothetical protein
VTSRVTVAVAALLALVAIAPVALYAAARTRGPDRPARPAQASDPALQRAQADAAAASVRVAAGARVRARNAVFKQSAPAAPAYGVARVRGPVALRSRPRGPVSARIGSTTQFGQPDVLSVARRRGRWLGVVSTALPNGQLGWVRRDSRALGFGRVRYSLHADLSSRTLELRRGSKRIIRFSVAIGRPGATTPTGRFAITDKLAGGSYGPYYGCCILALSGHQPHLPAGWRGGDRLAIHGTNAPTSVGQPSSAGCLRARDADLQVLMRRVPLGTPVFIHG